MTKKDSFLKSFLSSTNVGQDNITKGQLFRNALKENSSLLESTVGWIISSLIKKGILEETGKGPHGAKIFRRKK